MARRLYCLERSKGVGKDLGREYFLLNGLTNAMDYYIL